VIPLIPTPNRSLMLTAMIAGIGAIVSSLESLSLSRHYTDHSIFSWKIHRTRTKALLNSRLLVAFDRVFCYPAILVLHGIRVVAAALLIACIDHRLLFATFCLVIALLSILFTVRGPDGKNGADQMIKVIFTATGLCLLSPNAWVWWCCICFLSGQLVLSYTTSGLVRFRQRGWRDGTFLLLVLRQETYSHRWVWISATKYPLLVRAASLAILGFECLFPVSLILGQTGFMVVLAIGLLFHGVNAVVLGLNTFVWTFVGLYPAIWCLWWGLHHSKMIGWSWT
jgi:hypothetical protein